MSFSRLAGSVSARKYRTPAPDGSRPGIFWAPLPGPGERFPVAELLSVRHPENNASGRVMDRLGMRYRGLEPWYGRTVATHVLDRQAWRSAGT